MEATTQSPETIATTTVAICTVVGIIIRFIEKQLDKRHERKKRKAANEEHFKK